MKPHILIPALFCAAAVKTVRALKGAVLAAVGIYMVAEHLIIHRRES